MNIKELKGSVSTEEYLKGLTVPKELSTLGKVWESCIDCNHCRFVEQCRELGDYFYLKDETVMCHQVVDILLGNLDPEDLLNEEDN